MSQQLIIIFHPSIIEHHRASHTISSSTLLNISMQETSSPCTVTTRVTVLQSLENFLPNLMVIFFIFLSENTKGFPVAYMTTKILD